jgi:hypothetical protein
VNMTLKQKANVVPASLGALMQFFLLTSLLLLTSTLPASADEYKQVKTPVDYRNMPWTPPRDKSICREFGKVLNNYARKNQPLSCERKIPPEMGDFQRPRWQLLDPLEYLELLRRLDRYLFWDGAGVLGPKREFSEHAWQTQVEHNHKEKRIKLGLTKVDLNADGHPENVLRYENQFPCNPARGKPEFDPSSSAVNYFVVDDNLLAFQKVVINGFGADLFMYKGEAYFEWVTQYGGVRVTERMTPRAGRDSECHMRFKPGECPADQRPDFTFLEVCDYVFHRSAE